MAQWNLARFAETLLPLIDDDIERAVVIASDIVNGFTARHEAAWLQVFRSKLGLDDTADAAADRRLIEDFLELLEAGQKDFTQAFRALLSYNFV